MSKIQKSAAIALLSKGLTQAQTARKLGLSRQIVSHWMKSEDFRAEIDDAKANFLETTQKQEELEEQEKQHKQENVQGQEKLFVKVISPSHQPSKPLRYILREYELNLLQKIEESMLPQLSEGSTRAASILLKISLQRCALLGLNTQSLDVIQAIQILIDENFIPNSEIASIRMAFDEMRQKMKNVFLPLEEKG